MPRDQREVYCFLSDSSRKFYKAVQGSNGIYTITKDSIPYPIKYNPTNIDDAPFEFGTNSEYFSMARSIAYPLKFVKDAAAIIRDRYYTGKGGEENIFLTIIQWDGVRNIYALGYYGKLALPQRDENPESDMITVSTLDDSAWGILSQNDGVEYAIDCTSRNPKAVAVLFDGITLLNKYTYQTVQAPIQQPTTASLTAGILLPFVMVNQDGDSSGIVTKDQTGYAITYPVAGSPNFDKLKTDPSFFFSTAYAITGAEFEGSFTFQYNNNAPSLTGAGIQLSIRTSFGNRFVIYSRPFLSGQLVDGKIYTVSFDVTPINLVVSESLFMVLEFGNAPDGASHVTITPIVTNMYLRVKTIDQPQVCYGLRPLDLAKDLMAKVTRGRFTIGSSFFEENNKDILLSGDSLRSVPNAKIYTSFKDFFDSFNFIYFLAMRNVNGSLFIEKAIEVYKRGSTIIDLGDAIKLSVGAATEYQVNEVEQGSPNVDLRHPSGRMEFNATNSWAFPMINTGKKKSLITKYRLGCFDEQFLIHDYQGSSTVDNSGDKTVYVARISDNQGFASDDIETFENITVDNAILEPIIKTPLNNDILNFDKPTLTGIAPAGNTVNIYVDEVLDGSVLVDVNGDWIYDIQTALTAIDFPTETGIHTIDATFGTLSDPKSTIIVTIDTSVTSQIDILYPTSNANLYNNKPLISGVAQTGTVIDISLDGILIGTVVADGSCKWKFKSPVIANGTHSISVNTGADSVTFKVDSAVAYPIITYIGSELDGFTIVNNMPLIEGVAIPGTVVTLWLNYDLYQPLGTTTTDANGVWSFQVVPTTYTDPVSGIPVVLAPIRNGINVISTSLINHTVKINVLGYLLSRPVYSEITGVNDNTVFNTELSPSRMFRNWNPMWSAVMNQQRNEKAYFQKAGKNGELSTTLNAIVIHESSNITVASMGEPIALLEKVKITVNARRTFADTLYNFNNGGEIKFTYRGYTLYGLPIGSMKINSLRDSTQQWELLLSPRTPLTTLLNLYRNGTTIKVMKNGVFHSNYNTLHVVSYDFTPNPKYNDKDLYDDWFDSRNDAWIDNPQYIQKVQRTDPIIDQIISNGVPNLSLKMYRCSDAKLIDTKLYIAITPAIEPPDVVLEARYDMNDYPSDQYFFVIFSDDLPIGITERIETRSVWNGTILIESNNSTSKVGAFFYTGFQGIVRVEGLIKKRQPYLETSDTAEFESGDAKLLYAKLTNRRVIRFGTAFGLPDYLYLKIADYIAMDGLRIQGTSYSLPDGEKINPAEEYDGHPMFFYNVTLEFNTVQQGIAMGGNPINELNSVVLVVDGLAVGLPAGSLININYNA